MMQRKELLQQTIENGFINTPSAYPVILNNCKSSQLQNYSIRGKTEYSENLFNYTEPYDDTQITADENGWFDVTIDNSSGGSDKEAYCFTKVNLNLKPNTNYYLVLEVAERTGDIDIRPTNDYNRTSQFDTATRINSPDVGIRPPQKIVSKSTFDDESIRYMLRTHALCKSGKSGHIKFRIAVYETEKDVFLPYSKNYVGDKTENLFNYTEPYDDTQIIADENGWFDIAIDNTDGTGYKYVTFFTKPNAQLKPNKSYYVEQSLETKTGDINCYWVSNNTNDLSQFVSSLVDVSGYVTTRSDFTNCKYMMRGNIRCEPGKSGHIKFRIAVYETSENLFNYTEPYNDNQIIADEDGWFDVTIDNTEGTSTTFKWCYTAVNNELKPDTEYILFTEISECTGSITVQTLSQYSDSKSQFTNTPVRYNTAGTRSATITTLSSFDDCKTMLRSHCYCGAGRSGHAKFRISVYEAIRKPFEPYNKYKIPITVTGNNLFDISKSDGFTSQYTGLTNTITDNVITVSSTTNRIGYLTLGTFEAGTYYIGMTSEDYTGLQRITVNNVDSNISVNNLITISERSVIKIMINVGAGTTWHFTNIQIAKSNVATAYEPYHEPVTTNIYRDAPLADGESINYKNDNLPDITLEKGTNTITANTEVKPLEISASYKSHVRDYNSVKQYGVRWNGSVSTDCERLGDAVGLVANAHLGSLDSVQNDFDDIYPWSDIRTCNVDANGNVLAYLGDPSFKRDGSNGDVMVKIPKFYYKRIKSGVTEEFWICERQLPGYQLHPVFMDDGKEVSAVFHSAYNASVETLEDGTTILRSISGVQPAVRTTRATFRTRARAKGTGWSIEDISCVNALQMLYIVEYASTNSQSKLGSGVSSLNYTATHLAVEAGENTNEFVTSTTNANRYQVGQRIEIGKSQGVNNITMTPRTITAITAREDDADISVITFDGDPVASIAVGNMMWNIAPLNGSCDDLNGKSGWLVGENNYSDHYADVNYRGIEGFHAKLFRFIDGVNIKDRVVYYANSMADYADGVYDGKYRAVGYSNAKKHGYVSAFGYDEKAPWVMFPSAAVVGSSTFVPDYYYQNTGERLLLLGGFWDSSTFAGAFCFYCNNAFSNSTLFFGAHLLVKKPR